MLDGKTALITGSTSGIGLGVAQALAEAGANIILNGFGDEAAIERQRAALEELGVTARYAPADMTRPTEIAAMAEQAIAEFGAVDILVNNAGIQHVSPIEDFPPERWDMIIAINLSSVFHTTRSLLPAMRARGWGRIINIASAHGLVASKFKSAYVTAKHGVLGLTKTVALETAGDNITANAICPGYVRTPLVENQIGDQAAAHGISREEVIEKVILAPQPVKKFTEVAQIGALAVFLCSPAAETITGAALPIDGGWTAQ
jgi:3-hydroxybutyrate dehydrogenase